MQSEVDIEINKKLRKLEYLIKEKAYPSLRMPVEFSVFDDEELKPIKKLYDRYNQESEKLYSVYQEKYKNMVTRIVKRKVPKLVKEISNLAIGIK